MAKKITSNLRNGIKLRNNRPRWEPSPTNRKLGIKGRDFKDLDGNWINERGKLIMLADARHDWATIYREALMAGAKGIEARGELRDVLRDLPPAVDPEQRLRRLFVSDIIEKCRALVDGVEETVAPSDGRHRISDLVSAFFQKPTKDLTKATLIAYRTQAKKLLLKFKDHFVNGITAGMMHKWYEELCERHSISTANLVMGCTGSMYTWAIREDWIKPHESPMKKIGLKTPEGRLVYWPLATEIAMVKWCDENGFADVGDAITMGCWTGARQIDMCKPTIGELANETWRFTPQKTKRKHLEAMPGIMPIVRARINGRAERARHDGVRYLPGSAPFLWDIEFNRPHTTERIGKRYREARAAAVRSGLPELADILTLNLQDTRDTCVTRLFEAGISLDALCPWTGHSRKNAEKILRAHYIVLREEGAMETARKLEEFATKEGLRL